MTKLWLMGVWVLKILMAKRDYKVPFFKRIYYNFYGFTNNQVALYDLTKKNRKEYLSEFDWYKSRNINGKYSFILNNKLICNDLIKGYVKTPKVYVIKQNNLFYSYNHKKYDLKNVIALLKTKKNLYFKPIALGKGRDVFKITYENAKYFINYKEVPLDSLLKLLKEKDNYFLSAEIKQAKYLNHIYSKTSNTIRLITVRNKGKVEVLFAVQRFGIYETIPVDNGSKGGLVSKIDLNTGVLSAARRLYDKKIYKCHPDSHKQIEGAIVPHFKEIKKEIIKLMEKFPYLSFVAWDILVTNNSFYVIEANASSGINIIQVFGGQRNKSLGKFYKGHKIIKE